MEQQHEGGAACRVAEAPPREYDKEDVEKDNCNAAAEPDRHEFVQLHTTVYNKDWFFPIL